jgi:hypothetical protein
MGYSLALRNNKGRSLHNNWLGTWSKLPADETVYEATVADPTAAAIAIVLCFVFVIVMNVLNRDLIGLIISKQCN